MPVPPIQEVLDLLQENKVETAIDLLEQTVDEVPAHLTAYVILGRAYEAKGQLNRALQAWEQARFLLPNSPVAQEGKQRVLRRLEERSEGAKASRSTPPPKSTEASPPADESGSEAAPRPAGIDESEGPSSLEELRQQTEEESKQGGPRSGQEPEGRPGDLSSTPEDQIEQLEDAAPDSDLDQLIEELESARIDPQPDTAEVPEMEESSEREENDDEGEDLVSETLARIHAAQGQYREAARIYRQLATQEPERSQEFLEQAAEMRENAEATDEEE